MDKLLWSPNLKAVVKHIKATKPMMAELQTLLSGGSLALSSVEMAAVQKSYARKEEKEAPLLDNWN